AKLQRMGLVVGAELSSVAKFEQHRWHAGRREVRLQSKEELVTLGLGVVREYHFKPSNQFRVGGLLSIAFQGHEKLGGGLGSKPVDEQEEQLEANGAVGPAKVHREPRTIPGEDPLQQCRGLVRSQTLEAQLQPSPLIVGVIYGDHGALKLGFDFNDRIRHGRPLYALESPSFDMPPV